MFWRNRCCPEDTANPHVALAIQAWSPKTLDTTLSCLFSAPISIVRVFTNTWGAEVPVFGGMAVPTIPFGSLEGYVPFGCADVSWGPNRRLAACGAGFNKKPPITTAGSLRGWLDLYRPSGADAYTLDWQVIDDNIREYTSCAIDPDNNVYVTGNDGSTGPTTLIKYDPDGNKVWEKISPSRFSSERSFFHPVRCDWEGNLYLHGLLRSTDTTPGATFIDKFSPDGDFIGSVAEDAGDLIPPSPISGSPRYILNGSTIRAQQDFAVNYDESVAVASPQPSGAAVFRSGGLAWREGHFIPDGATPFFGLDNAVAWSHDGASVGLGSISLEVCKPGVPLPCAPADRMSLQNIRKFNSDGEQEWEKVLNEPAVPQFLHSAVRGIGFDTQGRVYVAGDFSTLRSGIDCAIIPREWNKRNTLRLEPDGSTGFEPNPFLFWGLNSYHNLGRGGTGVLEAGGNHLVPGRLDVYPGRIRIPPDDEEE